MRFNTIRLVFLFSLLPAPIVVSGAVGIDSVFINRGVLLSVDSVPMPIIGLNSESDFSATPFIKQYQRGDTLALFILNTDSIDHELIIKNFDTNSFIVRVDSTVEKTLVLDKKGLFPVISVSQEVNFSGLCGLIISEDISPGVQYFYWILKEYQTQWLNEYPSLTIDDSTFYQPEYFTINNHSFPDVQNDSLARIKARVGDHVRLYIYNAGLLNHNLHFHGYHATITGSSEFPSSLGRQKDSFPVNLGESLILDFTPNQPGKYPVHNHNLGATLGNNIYPNGMVVFIEVLE